MLNGLYRCLSLVLLIVFLPMWPAAPQSMAASTLLPALVTAATDVHERQDHTIDLSHHVPSRPSTALTSCVLAPIALSKHSLAGAPEDSDIIDILNGTGTGNFGWLSWTGRQDTPTLAASLTPPGDSSTYINPNDSQDHAVSMGDWVRGTTGVSNSRLVRDALDRLLMVDSIVPVWDNAAGTGGTLRYQIVRFARIRLTAYNLPKHNRISARFLGWETCAGIAPTPTPTLTPPATSQPTASATSTGTIVPTITATSSLPTDTPQPPPTVTILPTSTPTPMPTSMPINQRPLVEAGPDQRIKDLSMTAVLSGTVQDDGLSIGPLSSIWSVVSGLGLVTFGDPHDPTTTASFSLPGVYALRLTATDGELEGSDETLVVFLPANQPPSVDLGPDQAIPSHLTILPLLGDVRDDGQPITQTLSYYWEQVNGPGTVQWGTSDQAATTAEFSLPGVYTLRLTADDGTLIGSDDVQIAVMGTQPTHAPAPTTTPTLAPSQTITATALPTSTPTQTVTSSPTAPSGTSLPIRTPLPTPTPFRTATPTRTPTVSPTPSPTRTSSPTPTATPTNTPRLTPLPTDVGPNPPQAAWTVPGDSRNVLVWNNNLTSLLEGARVVAVSSEQVTAPAINALDDHTGTIWTTSSGQATDQYLTIQLPHGDQHTFDRIRLINESSVRGVKAFELRVSTTTNEPEAFSTVLTGIALNSFQVQEFVLAQPASAHYVQFIARTNYGDSCCISLRSLELIDGQRAGVPSLSSVSSSATAGSRPELLLDTSDRTVWSSANGQVSNQFVIFRVADPTEALIDRVVIHPGTVALEAIKDVEILVSATTDAPSAFRSVLDATVHNTDEAQTFSFPDGPVRARYLMLLAKNNHGSRTALRLATLQALTVESEGNVISLPAPPEVSRNQSPAQLSNGAVVVAVSSALDSASSPAAMLDYLAGPAWRTTSRTDQYAVVQLAVDMPVSLTGVQVAPRLDSTSSESVQDFEVWLSATTSDDTAFTKVLDGTVANDRTVQTFLFPNGPVAARYVKYVPRSNYGHTTTIATGAFDVLAPSMGGIVAVSSQASAHYRPELALDGNPSTEWRTASGAVSNQPLLLRLADSAIHPMYGVRVDPVTNSGPRAFSVRVSTTTTDETAFTTVYTGTVTSNDAAQEFRLPQVVDARLVQFIWHTGVGTNFIGVQEVAVLAIPATGAALIDVSSQRSTNESPLQAVDVDAENGRWMTAEGQTNNQSLTLALPRHGPWTIDHVALQPDSLSTSGESPRNVQVQVSTTTWDDTAFTTVMTSTLRNDTTEQHWFFAPTPARYVRLLVINNYGGRQIVLRGFRVYSPEIGSVQARFLNRSLDTSAYQWDFGDGATSTARDPQHTFATPGVYTVTLTVTNAGRSDRLSRRYVAFDMPQPAFTRTPDIPVEGQAIQFQDTSTDALGPIAYRSWVWGDGNQSVSNLPTPSHTYRDNGTPTVALTVANTRGITASISQTLTVTNVPPTVNAGSDFDLPWGELWEIAPIVSDPGVADRSSLICHWNFGDGTLSAAIAPCTSGSAAVPHTYTQPGRYTATLTVMDKDGGIATDTVVVTVTPRPTTLLYTGDRQASAGQLLRLRAKLRDTLAWQPVPGRRIEFTLGGQTIAAVTDDDGVAEAAINLSGSVTTIPATFAGDDWYGASDIDAPAGCESQRFPLDVAVVLDRSGSMTGQRMRDARTGAKIIAESLDLMTDQLAVVSFADHARLDAALSNDPITLLSAIDRIETGGGTAIHVGLTGAIDELHGPRHTPDAGRVIIVLSDGESDLTAAQAAAAEARAYGIRVIALAVGSDNQVMKMIASSPSDYYLAPTSEQIGGLALAIMDTLCDTRPTPTPTPVPTHTPTPVPSSAPTAIPPPTTTPTATPTPVPYPTQLAAPGWIGSPANGATVTGAVPITLTEEIDLANGSLDYWPVSDPTRVTTLATNVAGPGGTTLATLDTTQLANGSYIIRLRGTAADGRTLFSGIQVTVGGEYKPGRVRFSVTDLTVPLAGLPIMIGRTYDSLERDRVGDFGYGWTLSIGYPRLEVDQAQNVTVTQPNGKRVTFYFTPRSYGGVFGYLLAPAYTPEAGVYGSLTANGCPLIASSGGQYLCFLATAKYQPTTYTYTDPYGRMYTMGADGTLKTIKDLNNNILTFSSDGIRSSADGLHVAFIRDSQERVTQITDPAGNVYHYTYDGVGDLTEVTLPGIAMPTTYSYDGRHLFLKGLDTRGNMVVTATYYADSRLESETDAVGNTTRYTYDLVGRATTITNPDGGIVGQTYDSYGDLIKLVDPLGRTTTSTYTPNHNLQSVTDALGRTTTYTYDVNGHQTSVTGPLGTTQTTTYNRYGGPTSIKDMLGQVQTVVYDAAFRPTTITDTLGTRGSFTFDDHGSPLHVGLGTASPTDYTYDAYGNQVSETDPVGRWHTATYDHLGRVLTSTDALSHTTRYEYDALGRVRTTTDHLGHVTQYEYDTNGNRMAEVDPLGRRTSYAYDTANQRVKETYPDGTMVTFTYDWRGNRLAETNQAGAITAYAYDRAGHLIRVTHSDGAVRQDTTTYAYDEVGQKIRETNALGQSTTTTYTYDSTKHVTIVRVTDPLGHVTTSTLNAAGQLISRIDANQHETRFTYDVRGRLIRTTYADGTTTDQQYDGAGNLASRTDQAGNVTTYQYDDAHQLSWVKNPLGQQTSYRYDALGRITTITDANGHQTHLSYDDQQEAITKTWPDGSTEITTYDAVGNLLSQRMADEQTNRFRYDSMNRLLSATYADGHQASYTYTPTGQRRTVVDQRGTTSYAYDYHDNLITITQPNGQQLAYTYDAINQRRSLTTPAGTTRYTYDTANHLVSVTDLEGGVTTYAYDAVGSRTQRTLPNGVTTDYNYNTVNDVTTITHRQGNTPLATYRYTLSPVGLRLGVAETDRSTTAWTYDAANRLLRETRTDARGTTTGEAAFTYDSMGNRLTQTINGQTTTYTYNNLDQLVSAGSTQYAYDARGNLTTITDGSSSTRYSYDAQDHLTGVTLPDGTQASYGYDADGRRVHQTVDSQVTHYLWDEASRYGDVVLETDATGATQASYVLAGTELIVQNRGGPTNYYLYDGQGSVRALTDQAGTVTDRYSYDAFGTLHDEQGTTVNTYRYTGQQFDARTGLYSLRARFYHPEHGRFLSRDTYPIDVEDPFELNRYVYTAANPINASDPTGLVALGEYAAANNETSDGVREYHVYRHGVEYPKELLAKELGKRYALQARTINNELRAELTQLYGKDKAALYMKDVTVGSTEIQGTQYVSLNSGAPKQVIELMRSWYGNTFVRQAGAHAEQGLYLKARELLGTRSVDVIAEEMKAIGISHTLGPCAKICQPFFMDKSIEIYWLGRISRVFSNLAAGL